nr:hypothetical protein [Lachnospiraceae bacterium]
KIHDSLKMGVKCKITKTTKNSFTVKINNINPYKSIPEFYFEIKKASNPKMTLEKTGLVIKKGKKGKVKVTVKNDSVKSVKSKNTEIAKVSLKDKVIIIKALKKGKTEIKVKSKSGISKTIKVKVIS